MEIPKIFLIRIKRLCKLVLREVETSIVNLPRNKARGIVVKKQNKHGNKVILRNNHA